MIRNWLLLLIPITALSILIYLVGQQIYRLSANDPQVQMAEDVATALTAGQSAQALVPTSVVDLTQSLAPFVIVFDDQGSPLASSVQIYGRTPIPGAEVFEQVRENGQSHLTWQPDNSLKIASVVTRYTGSASGFVVAGRSLREVDSRTESLKQLVLIGWGASVAATLVGAVLLNRFKKPNLT